MNDRPPLSRRTALQSCGSVLFAGLAGCGRLNEQAPQLSIFLFNQTDRSYRVSVTLYEWQSGKEQTDARSYDTTFDLSGNEDARREDAATVDSYVVRYSAYRDGSRLVDQAHTHYYPEENGEIAFDIRDGELFRRFYHS